MGDGKNRSFSMPFDTEESPASRRRRLQRPMPFTFCGSLLPPLLLLPGLANHGEEHLVAADGQQGVGLARWKEHELSGVNPMRVARNGDFRLPFQDLHQRVKGCGVLAEALALVESEKRDRARLLSHQGSAHDRAVLEADQVE